MTCVIVKTNRRKGARRSCLLGAMVFVSSLYSLGGELGADTLRVADSRADSVSVYSLYNADEQPPLVGYDWSFGKKLIAPASLFLGSTLLGHFDSDVQRFRNDIAPNYQYGYDDVLQMLPGLGMYALRLVGVQGRSKSRGETLSASCYSSMITIAFTEGLKNTIGRTRPYSEYERNSFPSGHTMTAFTSATLLHKEYGDVSPWYSVGGYACASLVGVSRVLNNKHWLSDVLAGAGLGILSGEVGYMIKEHLFKEPNRTISYKEGNPSFIGLNAVCAPVGEDAETYIGDKHLQFGFQYGVGYAIEGAYFPFRHIGVGGKMTALYNFFDSDTPEIPLKSNYRAKNYSIAPGIYVAKELSPRVLVGAKQLYGFGGSFSFNVDSLTTEGSNRILYDEYTYGWSLESGIFLHYLVYNYLSLSFATNYAITNARYEFFEFGGNKRNTHNLSIEVGINVALN